MGEVEEFLGKLKRLDSNIYLYQKDVILNSTFVKSRMLDPNEMLDSLKSWHNLHPPHKAPFQGFNVGDAKNLSYDELEKITNNFSKENFIGSVECGSLFRGLMNDGDRVREVTVKTWDFVLSSAGGCADYPRRLHDEIVLLERSELKAHPYFVKLIGFCFQTKLAVVYDLKLNRLLWDSLSPAEFGSKELMKVAINYALLLKALTMGKFKLIFTSADIMVDEEYNIKLVNFGVRGRDRTHGNSNDDTVSDNTLMEKSYVFELGVTLLELITLRIRAWAHMSHLGLHITKRKGSSLVDETLNIDADTATEITQLIELCVRTQHAQRPCIDRAVDELAKIAGICPAVSDS